MLKFLSFKEITVLLMIFYLLTGIKVNAESRIKGNVDVEQLIPDDDNPCDNKIVVECGVEYIAELIPNAGSWTNYTDVPYNYTGSEQVFEFTAIATGLHIMDLDQGQGDADFMIMDACSNNAGNIINFYWTGEHEEYIELTEGVTYYIIADLYEASGETTVSLTINCPEDIEISEPDFDCFQGLGIAPSIDEGLNLDPLNPNTFVANDFTVDSETTFILRQITMDTNQVQAPNHAIFNFRGDNNGIPGDVLFSIEADVTSSIAYAAMFNEPVYHVVFNLDEPVTFDEGVYWLEPKLTTPQPSTVWWAATTNGTDGAPTMLSEDGGETWVALDGIESIFFVAGDCEELSTSDLNSFDFDYYPNPVTLELNLQTQKSIKTVEIYNLAGQKSMNFEKVKNGKINLESLTPGNYVVKIILEDGNIKVFKIMKK